MNRKSAEPPRLAKWLLSVACPRGQADPLAGDILERFHAGQTGLWFWRQVLFAGALRLRRAAPCHWPQLVFATAGPFHPLFRFSDARTYAANALQWWTMPWPCSQLLLEFSGPALFAVATLPILGLGLRIQGRFQWASLFRTGAINSVLFLLWLLITDAVMPYLMRPVVGRPYTRALPDAGIPLLQLALHDFILLVPFALFLLAAWLGCRPSSRAGSPRLAGR